MPGSGFLRPRAAFPARQRSAARAGGLCCHLPAVSRRGSCACPRYLPKGRPAPPRAGAHPIIRPRRQHFPAVSRRGGSPRTGAQTAAAARRLAAVAQWPGPGRPGRPRLPARPAARVAAQGVRLHWRWPHCPNHAQTLPVKSRRSGHPTDGDSDAQRARPHWHWRVMVGVVWGRRQ